jgi:hypothetical protein
LVLINKGVSLHHNQMDMKTLTGHLTKSDKKAIKAILDAGLLSAKVGKKSFFITAENGIYKVIFQQKDRGLIPVAGSPLKLSTYSATFSLN